MGLKGLGLSVPEALGPICHGAAALAAQPWTPETLTRE